MANNEKDRYLARVASIKQAAENGNSSLVLKRLGIVDARTAYDEIDLTKLQLYQKAVVMSERYGEDLTAELVKALELLHEGLEKREKAGSSEGLIRDYHETFLVGDGFLEGISVYSSNATRVLDSKYERDGLFDPTIASTHRNREILGVGLMSFFAELAKEVGNFVGVDADIAARVRDDSWRFRTPTSYFVRILNRGFARESMYTDFSGEETRIIYPVRFS